MGDSKDKDSGALLGDLESIRTLLEEEERLADEEAPSLSSESSDSETVPMLDDVVDLPADEPPAHPGAMTEDLFASLMGDGWKSQADEVLENARKTIDKQSQSWTPEHTDELNDALRVRIDGTIYDWLQKMLAEHIDDLRAQVLDAMSDEIKLRVKDALADAKKE